MGCRWCTCRATDRTIGRGRAPLGCRRCGGSPAFLEALDLGLIGPREELIVTRPSKFAPEFKARAIDLYRSSEGRTIADIARELGIGTETFRKWVRQDEADRGERDDRLTSKETEELKRLRRENAELKRTNEILRLASAFFAQEADPTRRRS